MDVLDWIFGKLGIVRAPNAQLSAGFLAAQQWRLDAIGPWSIEADTHNLDIKWRSPAALRGQWVPLDLQFHTDCGTASFDPDERMFELWELFLSRKSEFVRQLQDLTPEAVVETAEVVVYREGHGDWAYYTLQVLFTFASDGEHLYWANYDEEAGGFVSLDC